MKLKSTSRSSRSGTLLIDAAIAAAVVGLVVAFAVPAIRSKHEVVRRAAGLPAMHSDVEAELAVFRTTAPGIAPSINPSTSLASDTGEALQAVRQTRFDATLGLRGYSIAIFAPGTQRTTLAGAARIEPLAVPNWRPDGANLGTGPSTHELILRCSPSGKGIVSGSGLFPFGASVPILASPFPGKVFSQWTGTAIVANRALASTTVIIDEDRTLTAVFLP